ncbi:hypothetical protein MSG28_007068 [Choristoneura fumiferana]|uniref:Uncharacterized protein n=1 Tax=Choristoneura fumiferana TaxID=7141 RepID=A0ACC0JMI5_CHOFU|nr:hypothetical protein MSG28_007068 [Choristoneura fumiferana]
MAHNKLVTKITLAMKVAVVLLLLLAVSSALESRVVGGDFVSIKKFPHSVFLHCLCDEAESICGASVLNQMILLTAGHCMYDCKGKWAVQAYAGNEHLEKMSTMRTVQKYTIHRKYNPRTFENDISLVLLSKQLTLGANVKRVIVRNKVPDVKDVQVAGWGTVDEETEELAVKLKCVKQTLQSKQYCKELTAREDALCAKNSATQHPSRGDSGSALVTTNGEQIGLVSFRYSQRPELVVYTNIPSYKTWITVNSYNLDCNRK